MSKPTWEEFMFHYGCEWDTHQFLGWDELKICMEQQGMLRYEEDDMSTKDSNPKQAYGDTKVGLSSVPMGPLYLLAIAMMEGGMKYGKHNYRDMGCKASTYFDAAVGHLVSWHEGEDIDPDSGVHHLKTDDRPIRYPEGVHLRKNPVVSELKSKYPDPVAPYTQERKDAEELDKAVQQIVWRPPLFSRKNLLEWPVLVRPVDADPESGLPVKSPEIERQDSESHHTRVVQANRGIRAGEAVVYGKDVKELSDEDLTKLGQALFDKSGGADFIILEKKGMARMTAEKMKQIELILGSEDIHPLEVALPGVDKIPTRDGYHPDCQGCPEQDDCKEVDSDKHCSDCKHYSYDDYAVLHGWPSCSRDRILLKLDPKVANCPFFERKDYVEEA
jgi:hypothetical protein